MLKILRRLKAKHTFKTNSVVGKNFVCGDDARCYCKNSGKVIIGNNCDIQGVLISQGSGIISIGSNTTIRNDSVVGSVASISIGNNVIISNSVHIYDNNNHPTSPAVRKRMTEKGFYGTEWGWENAESSPVVINDNVWICERATILKGVTIGEGSIVACNSVVTKNVPAFSLVAGNPAKVVKSIK